MFQGYINGKFTSIDLISKKNFLGLFWFIWEIHTDACDCSYCTGYWDFEKNQKGVGWRGVPFKVIFPQSWKHGWKILTFRTANQYQHYLRIA